MFDLLCCLSFAVPCPLPSPQVQDVPAETPVSEPRPLEPMDVFELEGASDPRIAPDGRALVYRRAGFDVMTDRSRSALWRIDLESGEQRPLVSGAHSARWSPSGDRLAYVSLGQHGTEIFVRWMDDGTTVQVTRLPDSPGNLSWSRDGRHLAFTMEVAEEPESLASIPAAPKGAKWAPPAKVIRRFSYRSDGAGYLEDTYSQVFVVPADGGTPRQWTQGPYDHSGPLEWTADDEQLVLSANLREDRELEPNDSEVFVLDFGTGELTPLSTNRGPDSGQRISPDGQRVAWLSIFDQYLGYQSSRIVVGDLTGSESERVVLTDPDTNPSGLTWSDDGEHLYYAFDRHGETFVNRVAVATGEVAAITPALSSMGAGRPYSGGEFDVAAGRVVFVGGPGDSAGPGDLMLRSADPIVLPAPDAAGGAAEDRAVAAVDARPLTALNSDLLEQRLLGEVTEQWTQSSHDGLEVQSWILTPPDFDPSEQYPAILEIHGGPFAAYGPRFSFELQLMAAQGYVVVYGNPRGSTSYGAEFANLIHHNYPSNDYEDLLSMVDGAIALGYVDPDRLFVTGGSGGGVLTAWIVGQTDRFRAAVVAKPVINWISFALTADAYAFFHRYWFPGKPWDEFEHYWKRSPLSLVGNVKTPTMLLTGEADYRTPISESEQYYQALKLVGVETALVRIPEASHGIARRPSHLMSKVAHILAWFEKFDPASEESAESEESGD